MKKFVVAYMTFHENDLKQEIVEAEDKLQAALSYLGRGEVYTEATSLEELKDELFDSDEVINVLEIKSERASNWGPGMTGALPPFQFPTGAKPY